MYHSPPYGDRAPPIPSLTEKRFTRRRIGAARIDVHLKKVKEILATELPALNERMRELKIPGIILPVEGKGKKKKSEDTGEEK